MEYPGEKEEIAKTVFPDVFTIDYVRFIKNLINIKSIA
jgi:hypothetical protein